MNFLPNKLSRSDGFFPPEQSSAPSIILMNAQSILPKIEQLQIVSSLKNPHIICLTETWLNESVDSTLIHVPNYRLCRTDRRNRKGGGTAIFIRQDIDFCENTDKYRDLMYIEFTVVDLCAFKKFMICAYVPPNLNSESHRNIHQGLISITDDLLNTKPDYSEIIAGDFNNFDTE